jgi:hypothetical protein
MWFAATKSYDKKQKGEDFYQHLDSERLFTL